MPSGAKKRKAAKKRKENEVNNLNNNMPSFILDGNHQGDDARESDGGDGSSPVSREHDYQQRPFDEGNEVTETSSLSHLSQVTNSEPKGEVAGPFVGVENGVVENDREEEFEMDARGEDIIIQNIVKEDVHEVGCGSKETVDFEAYIALEREVKEDTHGSVSNGVPPVGKEKADSFLQEEIVQNSGTEKPVSYSNTNLNLDSTPNADLFNSVVPISEVVNHVRDIAHVGNTGVLDVTGLVSSDNEDKLVRKSNESNGTSLAKKNEEESFPELGENVKKFSDGSAPVYVDGSEMLTSSGAGAGADDTIENAENAVVSKVDGISMTAEKEDKVFPVLDGSSEASSEAASNTLSEDEIKVFTMSGAQAVDSLGDAAKFVASKAYGTSLTVEKDDKIIDGSDGNIEASSAIVSEDEVKMLTMSNAYAADFLDDAGKHGDSNVNDISPTEDKVIHIVDRNIEASSDATSATVCEEEVKMGTVSGANAVNSIEDGGKHVASKVDSISLEEEMEDKVIDALVGSAEASSDATSVTISKEEAKLLITSVENSGNHVACKVDGTSPVEVKEVKVVPVLDEKVEASSDANVANVNADERKVLTLSSCHATSTIENAGNDHPFQPSSVAVNESQVIISKSLCACTKETGNNMETTKEIQTSESDTKQPLIVPMPRAQTSWLSCCGLFEVFTGSGR